MSHKEFKSTNVCVTGLFWVGRNQTMANGSVTSITLTGSAMVNWNKKLLIQGVTTVIVVSIHALGHCFGISGSIKDSMSQGHHEQTRFVWEVETLVYSDEGRCLHRIVLGSATSRLCTTGTLVLIVGTLIPLFWTYGDVCLEVVAGIQAITKIAYIHRYACTWVYRYRTAKVHRYTLKGTSI